MIVARVLGYFAFSASHWRYGIRGHRFLLACFQNGEVLCIFRERRGQNEGEVIVVDYSEFFRRYYIIFANPLLVKQRVCDLYIYVVA